MDIKCKKCECRHNKNCCCTARKVKVGSMVDCETYEYSETKAQNLSLHNAKNMFEISKSLNPHVANKEAKIYCDAKCLFNENGICNANGITVLESSSNKKTPVCVTQIEK